MKSKIPIALTFVTGVVMILSYVVPALSGIEANLVLFGVVIFNVSLFYAIVSLVLSHTRRIIKRSDEWYNSIIIIVVLFSTLAIGLFQGIDATGYRFLWDGLFNPVNLTIRSMLAIFVMTAFYRAFRVKNTESLLLVVSTVFVLLKNAPIGAAISPVLPDIGDWLMLVIGKAGMRGLTISTAIGAVIFGVRVLIGYERTHS